MSMDWINPSIYNKYFTTIIEEMKEMQMKIAPKRVRLCPGCPANDLNLDTTPQFKFKAPVNDTKTVNIVGNIKNKLGGKIKSLF